MRREMMETVGAMRQELDLVAGLDEAAEDALVRLRLRLTWLQMAFQGLREAEVAELAAMRRGLLWAGDRSLLEEVGV
ncbi:MAG: hypothetical protein QE274_00250 [Verrucomicrobiaceae bacterium]|nr:hypothetical protein [Verrucomicrobiaceae bacterium]